MRATRGSGILAPRACVWSQIQEAEERKGGENANLGTVRAMVHVKSHWTQCGAPVPWLATE